MNLREAQYNIKTITIDNPMNNKIIRPISFYVYFSFHHNHLGLNSIHKAF